MKAVFLICLYLYCCNTFCNEKKSNEQSKCEEVVTPQSLTIGKVVKITAQGKWKKEFVIIEGSALEVVDTISNLSDFVYSIWGTRYLHKIFTSEQFHSFSTIDDKRQRVAIIKALLKKNPYGNIKKVLSCYYSGLPYSERIFLHESWLIKSKQTQKDKPRKPNAIVLNSSSSSSDEEFGSKDKKLSHNN